MSATTAEAITVEVIKVGGSLVGRASFVDDLRRWLEDESHRLPDTHRVLLVGGGPWVESLRQLDKGQPMEETFSHWLAIELMEMLGQTVGHWLPELWTTDNFDLLRQRCQSPGSSLLLATRFLREVEPKLPGLQLPVGWQVTSDSVAGRLAICLGANSLTLLKSASIPKNTVSKNAMSKNPASIGVNWPQAAESGWVDPFFPSLAKGLPYVRLLALPTHEKNE